MSPFSGFALKEIKKRSEGRSELSGRTDRPLDCMHFNHNKNRKEYNTPKEGIRVTIIEHLAYHIYHKEREQEVGLKECTNGWAIERLNERCVAFMSQIGKLEELDYELADSMLMWEQILTK
jgi:hypothetical protein